MTTSNEVRDSILYVDDVQTSPNIYDDDDDGPSWSIIMPYLGPDTHPTAISGGTFCCQTVQDNLGDAKICPDGIDNNNDSF